MSKKFVYVSVTLLIILLAGATVPISVYTANDKGFDACRAGDAAAQSKQVRLDLIKGETLSDVRKADAVHRFTLGCAGPTVYKLYLF